jgi:hypothetical protein
MKKLIIPALALTILQNTARRCARHRDRADRDSATFADSARFRQACHRAPISWQH